MPRLIVMLTVSLVMAGTAQAQMRSVVIPEAGGVAVPSRGTTGPRLAVKPQPLAPMAEEEVERLPRSAVEGLSPGLALIPALAAAVLGGSLAGGGGNGGGTARTR